MKPNVLSLKSPQQSRILVTKPSVIHKDLFLDKVAHILDEKVFTNNGPYVQELEQKIADYLGVPYATCVANATLGLLLAIKSLGLKGSVIVPSFTFVAMAHALLWSQVRPVFCDINDQFTLDIDHLESLIDDDTSAIMPVSTYGIPCDIEQIEALAKKHHLKVIYDSAPAFGSSYLNQKLGRFGDMEIFSFHATKIFSTFEGGVITTLDKDVNNLLKEYRNFGFVGYDVVDYLGINAKMSEVSAAFGVVNFSDMQRRIQANRSVHALYNQELEGIEGLILPTFMSGQDVNCHYYPIRVTDAFSLNRDELYDHFLEQGVFARRYYYPGVHAMQPYASMNLTSSDALPNTQQVAEEILCLPCYPDLEPEDQWHVIEILKRVLS